MSFRLVFQDTHITVSYFNTLVVYFRVVTGFIERGIRSNSKQFNDESSVLARKEVYSIFLAFYDFYFDNEYRLLKSVFIFIITRYFDILLVITFLKKFSCRLMMSFFSVQLLSLFKFSIFYDLILIMFLEYEYYCDRWTA